MDTDREETGVKMDAAVNQGPLGLRKILTERFQVEHGPASTYGMKNNEKTNFRCLKPPSL